jgi:polysaccharide export outer membrane protein
MNSTPPYRLLSLLLWLPLLFSCGSVKNVKYFDNLQDSVIRRQTEMIDPAINKNDILSIAVTSLNPEASAMFNMPNLPGGTAFGSGNSSLGNTAGYIVTEDGFIQFPVLGQIKAAGLSKKQLSQYITDQLVEKKLLRDPIVGVRQLNFHVTVLGEVGRPTVITVPNEKINLLEAIGMAGDLTLYANRQNVMLIREENGDKIVRRIDLGSSQTLSSPYYYLRSGDVVYAEPNETRIKSTSETRQLLPIVLSGMSVLIIALDRLIR